MCSSSEQGSPADKLSHTVLVIAPHPDDEVLGCGGTICRHIEAGDSVHVVIVTRGMPELFSTEIIERGRRELEQAHRLLGVSSVSFLDFPAPSLDVVPNYQIANRIAQVIETLMPAIMYVPHHGDIHRDHGCTYTAALVAARPIRGCSVRRLLAYETLSETEWSPPHAHHAFIPTVYVDIADYLERKLEAMACYRSQLKELPHPRSLDTIRAQSLLRGASVGLKAAEAFMLVREVIS